jgi:hypothetical protein
MLRVGFLPSDFNPMVLILGESEDLFRLAATLRQFAHHPGELPLAASRISLTASAGPLGVHAAGPGAFVWRLDALAQPSRLAGSEILECTTADEIPVKVSRGEYTDDFLPPAR